MTAATSTHRTFGSGSAATTTSEVPLMYECPEGCPRVYSSIKAAMLCPCDRYDENGRER